MRRFPVMIVAGLACIALGIAGSEWSRRHPPEKPAAVVPAAPVALTPDELASTEALPDLAPDTEALGEANRALEKQAQDAALPDDYAVPDAKAVLLSPLTLRNGIAHANAFFAVQEEGKQGAFQNVIRVSTDGASALVAHRPQVSAIAAAGPKLFFAQAGALFSIDAAKGGTAKGLTRFPRARITALGVSGDVLVATLVPKDHDPFSSDPNGAVVSVSLTDGKVKLLAKEQIRPAEAGTDGTRAVWIAGYPSDLWSLELSGTEPKKLATRADGPVFIEDGFVTYRHPVIGAPELVRLTLAGGEKVLAKGEIDRVATSWNDVWYSVAGTITGIDKFGENENVVAKLPRPLAELAVSDDAVYAVTRLDTGGHLLIRLPRSTPQGAR